MITLAAFIVAIGLLVAIHEYGHFQVARWCGVKVLRFAIGFGRPLLLWKGKNQETEFALCLLPLGGYVKMLDEREGPVAPEERHLAFNSQPVWKRFLIVAAGPVANLLLAAGLYTA
ncbi:MAG: site-2 protease family protein, partial [Brachymonas sp.]|nr:site-2 protease family protein [Brachymonas sp.]